MNKPTKSNPARTARQPEWLEHVRTCWAQGLSLKAYAEHAGLDVQRLDDWHRRLKALGLLGGDEAVSFTGVQVQGPRGVGSAKRLYFPSGLALEWDGGADLALVERLRW